MQSLQIIPFLVQGVAEFLPISSSAHLLLFAKWFEMGELDTLILAVLHFVPGIVFLCYFWKDVIALLFTFAHFCQGPMRFFREKNAQNIFLIALVVAVLPALCCGGLLVFLHMDLQHLHTAKLIGINSIVFGMILGVSDLVCSRMEHARWTIKKGMIFGILQMLAFIPGVSRLGISVTAARMLGFSRYESIRFASLAGIPILLAAGCAGLFQEGASLLPNLSVFCGFSALTFLLGASVLYLFIRFSRTYGFSLFALYRIALGILLLCLK